MLVRDGAGLTDGRLLECFVESQDEAAFEALMEFHGPMVFGVCRRVLTHHHDAEEAFQATFLVLAQKADSIIPRESVANWLYGVALRTSLKAKSMRAKLRVREQALPALPQFVAAQAEDRWPELAPVLDQELSRLPEKYRTAVVLCDLEGKTHKEAARQLGRSEGAVSMRLSRARKLLADRLTRRGLALSTGSLVVLLAQNAASAAIAPSLKISTVKAAGLTAAKHAAAAGLISAEVARLTEGVLQSMFTHTLVKGTAIVALMLAFGLGAGGIVYSYQFGGGAAPEPAATGSTANPPQGFGGGIGNSSSSSRPTTTVSEGDLEDSPNVAAIQASFPKKTEVEFVDTPLKEAINILKEQHKIEIMLDSTALSDEGIAEDSVVTMTIANVRFDSVLNLILAPLQLDWIIQNEVLWITTRTVANATMRTDVYHLPNLGKGVAAKEVGTLIEDTISPNSWEQQGGEGSLHIVDNLLVIRQSQRNHREIAQLLAKLDSSRAK